MVKLGAFFHATPHRKCFQDYVQGNFRHVYLGDDKACKVVGKVKVMIKVQNKNSRKENNRGEKLLQLKKQQERRDKIEIKRKAKKEKRKGGSER